MFQLREKLKHYGVESMDEIALVEDSNNANMNRGYAFLDFASRSDAVDAHKRLIRKEVVFGLEKPAKVSFADSFLDPEDEMMAQVLTMQDHLFVACKLSSCHCLLLSVGGVYKGRHGCHLPIHLKVFSFMSLYGSLECFLTTF